MIYFIVFDKWVVEICLEMNLCSLLTFSANHLLCLLLSFEFKFLVRGSIIILPVVIFNYYLHILLLLKLLFKIFVARKFRKSLFTLWRRWDRFILIFLYIAINWNDFIAFSYSLLVYADFHLWVERLAFLHINIANVTILNLFIWLSFRIWI